MKTGGNNTGVVTSFLVLSMILTGCATSSRVAELEHATDENLNAIGMSLDEEINPKLQDLSNQIATLESKYDTEIPNMLRFIKKKLDSDEFITFQGEYAQFSDQCIGNDTELLNSIENIIADVGLTNGRVDDLFKKISDEEAGRTLAMTKLENDMKKVIEERYQALDRSYAELYRDFKKLGVKSDVVCQRIDQFEENCGPRFETLRQGILEQIRALEELHKAWSSTCENIGINIDNLKKMGKGFGEVDAAGTTVEEKTATPSGIDGSEN